MLSTQILPRALAAFLLASCSSPAPAPVASNALAARSAPTSSTHTASPLPLRALIVGGGPSPSQSQAGIEGNARYVAGLLQAARASRLLWNNGARQSATVSAVALNRDAYLRRLALAFALSEDWPRETVGFRTPRLPRLDGAASKSSIAREISGLGRDLKADETALLYFTGHGSPGSKPRSAPALKSRLKRGADEEDADEDDFDNTLYWMWNENSLGVRELAPMLAGVPAQNPLVLVMVQCHAGGFANLIFQGGNPNAQLVRRDVCGFFATTAERMSSGCTPLVNESESEDFTSHFFGALSGQGRGGRSVLEADFDADGRASLLEAFAYASLHDHSIDVPTCTSVQFLQHFFPPTDAWYQQRYSVLESLASPWQKALLQGLSRELKLSSQNRLAAAHDEALKLLDSESGPLDVGWSKPLLAQSDALMRDLQARLPRLKQPDGSPSYARARQSALKYLQANPAEWRGFARNIERESEQDENASVREAMLWRFVVTCLTLAGERKLEQIGTPAQKAAFARLRASESRSLFSSPATPAPGSEAAGQAARGGVGF